MPSDLVPGIDYVFHINDGGIWKGLMCARTLDVPVNTDMLETTGPGDGNWKTFKPQVHSYGINLQYVMSLDASVNLTFPQLRALQFAKTQLLWRTVMTSQQGNTYQEQGYAFIQNSVPTGSFDGVTTFGIAFQGTGKIDQIFTPPPPTTGEVFRYPAMGSTAPTTPDQNFVEIPGLGNKNIIEVVKDGRGNNDIILTGTPVNQEVLYETNGDDGIFTWAFPFMPGESYYIIYQNL